MAVRAGSCTSRADPRYRGSAIERVPHREDSVRVPDRRPSGPSPRQHPTPHEALAPHAAAMVHLQQSAGNQMAQRVLVQRQPATEEQRAEAYLRQKLEQQDRYIKRGFESLKYALGPDLEAREPAIDGVLIVYDATGVLTVGMLDSLERSLLPVPIAENVTRPMRSLREDVELRNKLLEAWDDPVAWHRAEMKKWDEYLSRPPVF
jgi:hypothetical protein